MQRTYWLSANVLKAAEDKTNIGAFVASPTDPRGQSVPATTTGPYAPRYFIRLSPTGDPNAAETYNLGNGSIPNVDQRSVVDAGFLELT
jgi:glucoamylase